MGRYRHQIYTNDCRTKWVAARGVSLNKLVEEWATVALAQLDAENHYRLRAARGRPEVGLEFVDKLDRTLGRQSARMKATG